MIEATLAAATQLRVLVRTAGVHGVPGVRLRRSLVRGPDEVEILVEDRLAPQDEVYESRGIRFYVDAECAADLGRVTLDLSGRDFVVRQHSRGS